MNDDSTKPLFSSSYWNPEYLKKRGWPESAKEDAEGGDIEAQMFLAMVNFNATKNINETIKWYKRAIEEHQSIEAMLNLATIYENGSLGSDVKLIEAVELMEKIAGKVPPQYRKHPKILDIMKKVGWYHLGAKTPINTTKDRQQSLPADKASVDKGQLCLETAVSLDAKDSGTPAALGNMYMGGTHPHIPKNYPKGLKYIQRAAELGNGKCAYQLAMVYSNGLFVPVDEDKYTYWMERAQELGYSAVANVAGMN